MTKKYTLTTSEETVTENPEDIIRLMKLAGLSNAQAVAEEEVNEEVYEPTEANDELDLDDYSKKSPESISKQKKSLDKAPSKGDNPLEYSLDENEIYEAMMKEFNELEESKPDFLDLDKDGDKEESMKKAAKDKKEKADESLDEATEGCADCEWIKDETDGDIDTCDECAAEKNESVVTEDKSFTDGTIKKLQYLVNTNYDVYEEMGDIFDMFGSPYTADDWLSHMKLTIDEIFTKEGSPVPPEVAKVYNDLEAYSKQTELQAKRRANTDKNGANDAIYGPENEDELYIRDNFAQQWHDAFHKVQYQLGLEAEEDFDESSDMDRLKKLSGVERESQINEDESVWADFKKAYETMDLESEDRMFFSMKNWSGHRFEIQSDIEGENGTVVLGMHVADEDGEPDFLQNRKFALSDIEANITGAGWYADGGTVLKTTIGDFEGMDMEEEEVTEPNESSDMDRLKKLSGM